MRLRYGTLPPVLALLTLPCFAQEITRDNYFGMIPPTRIVGQTQASATLRLFGDRASPTFRDADPVDGIARGRTVLRLAARQGVRSSHMIMVDGIVIQRHRSSFHPRSTAVAITTFLRFSASSASSALN